MTAPIRPAGSPPEGYRGPRRSLILAGGGMRVAYQAGVIRALVESGLTFMHADGASGGLLNLAMLFSGLAPEEMCDRWRTLAVRDFISFLPVTEYLKLSNGLALGDADGIVAKVFPHLGIDVAKINRARGMTGTFNVCNFTRKVNEAIPHDRVDLDLLVAGISLPIFMPPVQKGDSLYLDSVWIKDANLMEAVRRGADELWLIWCIGNTARYERGLFQQYVHMIELSANGALFEEFDRINEINERIRQGQVVDSHSRPMTLHLIKPALPLPLDPALFFGTIDYATLIDMGYRDACRYLETRTEQGVPFQPEATRMTDATLGLTFRETMAGPFALGPTDPAAGAQQGRSQGTELSMHSTITIPDLDRFLEDPTHAGNLTAHIDFTPFGANIPSTDGVFNLFSPADDPRMKLMVYELGFRHDGKDYYLAGRKQVKDDPGWDLWADTTTLFTRLHQGRDPSGTVVGAGILSLGVKELVSLVSTMRALNASSAAQKVEALAKFGRFFLGDLWENYSRMASP